MFNPDLKKLLKGCNSRYSLVVGTAKRAREIREEAIEREEPIDVKTVSLQLTKFLKVSMLLRNLTSLSQTINNEQFNCYCCR